MSSRRIVFLSLLSLALPSLGGAQSLRGGPSSVSRMYREARREHLPFYQTSASVRRAVANERLVRLRADRDLAIADVSFPYARPQTRLFVDRLSRQYHAACGERLVVTSAVRPATRQPPNGSAR